MKLILRGYGVNMTNAQKFNARMQARDVTISRGTGRIPGSPQDLVAQSGPRGVLLNWRPPSGYSDDIVGWRVYKGDENSLFAVINNPFTTQIFVESTAGASPVNLNLFVSSISRLGTESLKVAAKGVATAEAGAPTMPPTPDTFTSPFIVRTPTFR